MNDVVPRSVLWLGLASCALLVLLEVLYAVVLYLGISALENPGEPIDNPYFTAMEVLILVMMPPMVVSAVTVHGTAETGRKPFALAAVAFVTVLAAITTTVHATILFLSREPTFAGLDHIFAFEWPSVVYILDILAWDYFFALFAACLAFSFGRTGIEGWVRRILLVSALLSFAGIWGALIDDMQIRNIGIVGYVPVFTVAVGLLGWRFARQLSSGPQ